MEVKQNDILYLNSENGLTYKIEVISVNFYRPPEMIYAIDTIDPNGNSYYMSENGLNYKIEVISVDFYRPPEMIYAIDIIDPNGNSYYMSYGDFYFCGQDFIDKCTKEND